MDDLVPQILSPAGTAFSDTANWMPVSGEFIADGGEEWIIIGNFYKRADLTIEEVVGATDISMCYYFLDDVCVLDMDGAAGNYTITDTAICSGEDLTFGGRHGEGITYLWDNGSTDSMRNITTPGIYWVKSIDINSCSIHADSFYVGQKITTLPIDLGADTIICSNFPLILDAGNDLFTGYEWSTGANEPSIEVNILGQYFVTADAECYRGSDTIVLYLAMPPEVVLPPDTVLCKGIPVVLKADQPGMIYSWNTGDSACCIEELVVSNICGDKAVDEIKIIYSGCDNCILIPNAFSPNNDGMNDKFEVLVNCVMSTYRLSIFNRWGQLVFSSVKPGNNWDGTYKEQIADMGVYYYSIEASPVIKEAGKISKKGEITLIR